MEYYVARGKRNINSNYNYHSNCSLFLVILFTIFQRIKNILLKRIEIKKNFEREIAETQIELPEATLRSMTLMKQYITL